ncbi:MAG: GTP-binding protein [Xanthomonadales bacterium]|nr:GTP-binding protein [Xanthomonadales bacterium]
MATHKTENIRNLALVGQSGAGKSTLIEALLAKTGTIKTMGSHQRGSLVTDFDPLEKLHQHSLDSAIVGFEYDGVHCNFIDTPGYPDFRGPTLAAMAAVETTAIVINAQSGIELSTRRLMQRAVDRKLCRMIIINKIDTDTVDLTQLVRKIRAEFGNQCLPINLPADNHSTVRDCFFHTEGETDIFSLSAAHDEINDQVAEVDDELMDIYLEQGELNREQLHQAFEIALRQGHLVPICFVSAKSGAGIDELLKFCKRLAPNPFEGNPPPFLKGEGENAVAVSAEPDADAHVIAHVFKITNDPFSA